MDTANYIWYTVSVDYAGEDFSRFSLHSRKIEEMSSVFDSMCETLLADEEPLAEGSVHVTMYEQHTQIGSLIPMRKLEVQQDGKYRIGYLATPQDLKLKPFLARKLNTIGVNDNYVSAQPTL